MKKPLKLAAIEKWSYHQTQKCFLHCLLIFGAPFWTVSKLKSKHTRQHLPVLLPTLCSCAQGKIWMGRASERQRGSMVQKGSWRCWGQTLLPRAQQEHWRHWHKLQHRTQPWGNSISHVVRESPSSRIAPVCWDAALRSCDVGWALRRGLDRRSPPQGVSSPRVSSSG